ncbi:pimeloyl-ACP methyl ester carboxylesterase [Desulfuromonas soudanensis]|uniref:Pimeloyl-ACP methyl ester carboxylesterase n=1 Tax=Desulfuromonas soudanensis TaxID=1603606 RepID=A0A0M4D813_9BACT|nr:alpha/beta fold hydrolase [Desulfuromonas soudanensis]ALC17397.1 pimeloyl-ACP methyl ester carboxylesterase [Desulfuromonas soudanensis]
MESLYPFSSHYLELGDLNYHYLDEGTGDPVVMVHGNPSWSFYYRNLVLSLRSDYRVVVPDHIGCGFSSKPDDSAYPYTLQQRVDDLDALLESLEIRERITLVLHDWGGMIGMAYACRHPERIARLVILNTAAFHLPAGKTFPLGLKICRDTFLGTLLVRGFNAFARGAARVGCKRNPMTRELRDAYCSPYDSWKNRIATLRFVQDIPLEPEDPGYDLITEVEQGLARFINRPMVICWGEMDFVFDSQFLTEWTRRFPEAEVHAFADCGHYILEDAKDEVIPIIRDFLAAHPLAPRP